MKPSIKAINGSVPKNLFTGNLFKVDKPVRLPRRKTPLDQHIALAHEVRNPLSNINLSLKMLQIHAKDDESLEYLDIIQRSSDRISRLVNDFLQVKSVKEKLPEKNSIHQLIEEVLAITKDQLVLKKTNVQTDYSSDDTGIMLNGPEIKICLTNIIINAIDAMEPGSGKLTLTTRATEEYFFLHIGDNGCGISKGNLSKIFAPYFTNKSGGMGLGLSTTYHLLRSNHVGIKVHSELGEGTRFTLLFDKKLR